MAEGRTPTISARMRVKGTEEVRGAFEDVRKSGEQTFGSLRRSAQAVGQAVDKTAEVAVSTTKTAVSTATTSVGIIGGALTGLAGIAGGVVDAVLGIATAVAKGAVLVAGATAGAYFAARQFAIGIAEGNDEVSRQAQALGMSVESLSRWQAAVRIAGGDAKTVGGAFESVRNKMIDVAKGVDGADAAFRQLGIRVRDGNGHLKGTEALFGEVIDQLAMIPDEGIRSSAAFDVLGSSATSLLPVLRRGTAGLRELQEQADAYGTALTTAGAAENNALLEKTRRMDEALKGLGTRFSNAFLPVFTKSAGVVADWFEKNGEAIDKWVDKAGETFETLVTDVVALFSDGSRMPKLQNSWLADFYGPAQALKNLVLDVIDAIGGKGISRSPWLDDFVDTLGEAWNAVKSIVGLIGELTGIGSPGFDLAQGFRDATAALQSFQQGIAGGAGDITWASNVGVTVALLAGGIASLAGLIADNRDSITGFAITAASLFGDLAEAVRGILNGEGVGEDNAFAWLPKLIADIQAKFEELKAFGTSVWDEIVKTWETLKGVGQSIIDVMDGIAKAMGLGDWKTLGIILVIGQLSGAFKLIATLATVVASLAVFFANLLGILGTLWGAFIAFSAFVAGIVGLPVAVVAAIIAAVAAILVAIFLFRDQIWGVLTAIFGFIGDGFKAAFDVVGGLLQALGDLFGAVFAGIGAAAQAAWDFIVGVWNAAIGFFGGIVDGITEAWNGFWGAIGAGAQSAWDGIASVFGGLIDFFADPLGKIADMWSGLWDGIKNGAASAWDGLKGFFGFGGDTPGGDGPSFDVGTARVPGADGAPMRATIHGGERILTVAENKRWGALIDSLVNMTTLPTTPFAMGPTAVPAGAGAGGGSGSSSTAYFDLNGQRSRLSGEDGQIRRLQSSMRRAARMATGPSPRWRTT